MLVLNRADQQANLHLKGPPIICISNFNYFLNDFTNVKYTSLLNKEVISI